MIRGSAVLQTVNAAGVFGYVSADGARRLAGRIGNIIEAMVSQSPRQVGINQPSLHYRETIFGIDIQYLAHARQFDYNAAIDRKSSA